SIEESADLANRFFFYVGVIGTFLGGVIIWFVTGRITKPILSLNEISERMVNLDFDAKYEGKAKNEIGLLGENMNKLSQSLEKNISDLKSANNELTRDIEKKDKIDEMRREFLSNVSHELKTPIALIQGYAEALQEGIGEDPESRDYYCEVIVDEAAKMNQIVQKLMTLNQLEFGREVAQMERFELTSLIHNALSQSEILAQKNGIKIELSAAEEVHVWADAFMTEEVFQNYLSNAIHYCSGEKKIKISVEHKEDTVHISVFNTGAPIPEESLPLLWDKFYKVDKARTREYGGSGVGLSIVKAMMESMNQGYGVLNEADGVTFWFELECADRKSEG
ncbi:MAG: HAMP domain-containing protein, partial [Lachnospiraceae bacterium]|nr:HAMP domain-containing protein [Lachnospiraceae bacterium]